MEIQGKFDAQRFFETLAAIIGNRENVNVTVTVRQDEQEQSDEETKAS